MEPIEIWDKLCEGFILSLTYFNNPKKRIYYIYILSSIVIAYFVFLRKKPKGSFINYIFNKKVWTNKSALVDYILLFFNGIIKVIFIGPFLVYGLYLSFYTNEYLLETFGYSSIMLNSTQTVVLYTITLNIVSDFISYIFHLLFHKIPFLWEFHKIHHSATSLNPITQYRIHPVELIVNNIKALIVFGLITGLFDYFSNHQVNKTLFLGVGVISFVFMFFGANLRHSHVPLKYPHFLEHILISPFQHQIHHSENKLHFDKNMGSKLAIWDWMFGTLIYSKSVKKLRFGLGEKDNPNYITFWKNIYKPFRNNYISIRSLFIKK